MYSNVVDNVEYIAISDSQFLLDSQIKCTKLHNLIGSSTSDVNSSLDCCTGMQLFLPGALLRVHMYTFTLVSILLALQVSVHRAGHNNVP